MNFMEMAGDSPKSSNAAHVDEVYWPTAEPDKVIATLQDKRDEFWACLVRGGIDKRIFLAWNYYYNHFYDESSWFVRDIVRGGPKGNIAKIGVGHYRSFLHGIKTYVTKDKPAWDTQALNSDNDALLAAKMGNEVLDYFMVHKGAEENVDLAVEESLIFSISYVMARWDEMAGNESRGDPSTGQIFYDGDVRLENLNIYDVIFDHTQRNRKNSRWVLTRTPAVKWELIEKHGSDLKDAILDGDTRDGCRYTLQMDPYVANSDTVTLWEFWHDRTPLLPDGRYLSFVGDKILETGPLPKWCTRKPVYAMSPAPMLATPFGHTPAFDLLGIQEAINAEATTILTNHQNLGPTKLWIKQGDSINLAELEPGWNVLQTDTKPEALNFAGGSSREFIPFKDSLVRDGEYISGMNSVARGQPEANLRSASAVEFIEQKAVQYQAPIAGAYYRFLSELGTGVLDILKSEADSPRVMYVAGINNRTMQKSFSAEGLSKVARVAVIPGNAATQTTAGKSQMATELLQSGMLKTPEEYITVRTTGQVRPLTEANDAQLDKCHKENELLRNAASWPPNSSPVTADILDNQVFHILKHQSIIDSPEVASDPFIYPAVKAHILQHLEILLSIEGQTYQRILGYSVPVPPINGMMPQGGTGEANPNQQTQQVPGIGGPPEGAMPDAGGQPPAEGNMPGGME